MVGILSEGDLLRRPEIGAEPRRSRWLDALLGPGEAAEAYVRSHGQRVKDVMTRAPLTVKETTPLHEVASLMERRRVKRLPVVRAGKLVGIISRAHLLRALASLNRELPKSQRTDTPSATVFFGNWQAGLGVRGRCRCGRAEWRCRYMGKDIGSGSKRRTEGPGGEHARREKDRRPPGLQLSAFIGHVSFSRSTAPMSLHATLREGAPASRRHIVIVGAAGRDFHNFNVVFRDDPGAEVVAFTAAQITGIAGRCYPPSLAGPLYPNGIPIAEERELEALCRAHAPRGSGVSNEKNYRRRRDALIDKKCNLDRRIVAVCRLELERVRPVVVRGSTAPAAQAIQ